MGSAAQRRASGELDSIVAERVALVAGVLAAALLGGVATLLLGTSGSLGRGVLAERAANRSGLVEATWRRIAADRELWFGEAEGAVSSFDPAAKPPGADPLAPEDLGPDAPAFSALLDEARRLRSAGVDPLRVHQALDGAANLARGPVRAAEVGLERLRFESSEQVLAPSFDDFWAQTPPAVLVDGLPAVAIGYLTVAERLDPDRRRECARQLAEWIANGALALPEQPARWSLPRGGGQPTLSRSPRVRSLVDSIEGLAGVPLEGARAALDSAAVSAATHEHLIELGWTSKPGPSFMPEGGGFWAAAARAEGGFGARWISTGELAAKLRDSVASGTIEDGELAVALGPDDIGLGAAVGPPIRLAGLPLEAQLRHPDPSFMAASGGARVRAIAFGLYALAALALAAGWTTRNSLMRQRRLAALRSRWVAAVSHELRTPVAALTLTAGRLERTRLEHPERLPRYHEAIRAESERLERLVAQVMDIARIERGRPPALRLEALDPSAVLEGIVERGRLALADRGLELELDRSELPAVVVLDSLALGRALENLIENAAHHSGGEVVLVRWRRDGSNLLVDVRDDGRGLPDDSRLFDAFHRGEGADNARGVGLGLGIARELVRAHGGDLTALAGTDGRFKGAAFRILLPLRAAPGDERRDQSEERSA
ncbi:sensor histidine kinase [Engelhardtia mirabilis]|uniref:histidine kinase n=1 Tax=Engelhardtia mirabilis TaxID=2528011 RepID=A0A518BI58_9BACT|nr:Sensor protein KdpD [Planctomycetes bacterium Pla133]QDV00996.1 Sensor protein KdpD [Planctomycetes bacterium Pla86]